MTYEHSLEDVQLDFQDVHNDITNQTEATQDGINVSLYCDRLVNILVDNVNKDIELTPISIESIQLAIQAIYSNVGATYVLESYRDTQFTEYALENVSVFVKELWVKVKNSIQTLWGKVTKFWDDNFAGLKSVRKHLEATLNTVQKEYHVNESRQSVRVNETVLSAFAVNKDVDDVVVGSFIVTHLSNFERLDEIIQRTKQFNQHVKSIRQEEFEKDIDPFLGTISNSLTSRVFSFGHNVRPIIGGEYITVEYNIEDGGSDIDIDVDKTVLEKNLDKREVYISDHHKLKSLIKKTIDVIDETIKYAAVQDKVQKEFTDLIHVYDKIIKEGDSVITKNVNKTIRMIYKINSCMPGFFSLIVISNVKLARSIVNYANLCLKEA